ncbi:MAG: hypothetical protein Greene041619_124 [Candidatus Peregrinibacteria bacterium Greene0416_19]|nr:MAG: hypothetical protein Greene041619_124 [Candidatus Peregrinibacteria bacterium Greene0416_19]
MRIQSTRDGYIFLITALFVGAISLAATISLMLLGWAAEQNGLTYGQATQSLELARGCIEFAINMLRSDMTYAGGNTLVFSQGSCTIMSVQGHGPSNRTICAEGVSGQTKKRLKASVEELFPTPIVISYEEVLTAESCAALVALQPVPTGSIPSSAFVAVSSSVSSSPGPPSSSSSLASSSNPSSTPASSSSSAASSSAAAPSSAASSAQSSVQASSSSSSAAASSVASSGASSSDPDSCFPFTIAGNGTITTDNDMNITFENLEAKIENPSGTHMKTFVCRSENGGDYSPLFGGQLSDDCTGINDNKYGDEMQEDGIDSRTYGNVAASTSYSFKVHAYLKIGPNTWSYTSTSTDGTGRVLILKKGANVQAHPSIGNSAPLMQFLGDRGLLDGNNLLNIGNADLLLLTELNDSPGSASADYDDDVLRIQGQQDFMCGMGS